MTASSRREFLHFAAGGALSATVSRMLLGSAHATEPCDSFGSLRAATHSARALGTDVSITALHVDSKTARSAIEDAFAELELVEQLMSIYRPDSQVSRLNRDGVFDRPHPYFVEVLRAAREMSRHSGGGFDVTVQPLWALFAETKKSGALPDAEAIQQARQQVNWRSIELSVSQVRLRGDGTAITLNGIAQGYASDKASEALRRRGVQHALINTGEIGTLGKSQDGDAWTVGIQHPRREDAYISLAKLAGRCLATSGDYATTFSDDYRFNHLFDPHTGRSPTELSSVSIAAPTAMQADALSTAVFVLGPEKGTQLIRSISGTDAMIVLKNGRTLVTEGFPLTS